MAGMFPLSGSIDPKAFPFAILEHHLRGATGSLRVEGPTYHKALYFRSGQVLFGSSNDPRDQLGSILIESGRITPDQLEEVNAKVGPGNPLAKLLSESGVVSQRELGEAARTKVEQILSDLLTYTSGSYDFEEDVLPKGAVDLKLSAERLTLAASRRIDDRAFVLRHVESLQTIVRPRADLLARCADLELGVFPELIDGHRTLKELAHDSGLEEFEAAKIACALLFLGWVQNAEPEPEALFVSTDDGDEDSIDLGAEAEEGIAMAEPYDDVDSDATVAIPAPSFENAASFEETESYEVPEGHAAFPGIDPGANLMADTYADTGVDIVEPDIPDAEPWAPAPFETEEELAPVILPEPEVETPPPALLPTAEVFAADSPGATETFAEESDPSTEIDMSIPPTPAGQMSSLPLVPPPPRHEPEPDAPTQATAPPSREDLAALDALLNSRSLDAPLRPGGRGGAAANAWKPQFMAGASTTVGRSARRHAERGKGPVIAGITALVLLGGAAGVYYLGGPLALFDRFSGTEASPTPAAAPPPTTLAPTMSTAPLAPDQTPTQAETPTSTPGEASTPAAALPTATPSPTSTAAGVPGSVDASRAALRSGRFDDAAAGFASSMGGAGTHAIQLLVACARESVDKAVQAVSAPALYVLPVDFKGKACYRICWGAYTSQADAGAALQTVPSYFIDNGARPRVVPLSELLP